MPFSEGHASTTHVSFVMKVPHIFFVTVIPEVASRSTISREGLTVSTAPTWWRITFGHMAVSVAPNAEYWDTDSASIRRAAASRVNVAFEDERPARAGHPGLVTPSAARLL